MRDPASKGVIGDGTADEQGVGGSGLVGQPDPPEGDITAVVPSGGAAFTFADDDSEVPKSTLPPPHPPPPSSSSSSSSSKDRSELRSGCDEVEPCIARLPPPPPPRGGEFVRRRCCCDDVVTRLPQPPLLVLSGSPWRRLL